MKFYRLKMAAVEFIINPVCLLLVSLITLALCSGQDVIIPSVGIVPSIQSGINQTVFVEGLGMIPGLQAQLIEQYFRKWNFTGIGDITDIKYEPSLTIQWDPPEGYFSPTTLGLYVQASEPEAIIFYEVSVTGTAMNVNLTSPTATFQSPYVQVQTPYMGPNMDPAQYRNMSVTLMAVTLHQLHIVKSQQIVLNYFVEGQARKNSQGFLIPGRESSGFFIKFGLEMVSSLRATAAIIQELADYNSNMSVGTYPKQLSVMRLTDLDRELTGFDGGFPMNVSSGGQYGILVPHHSGVKFSGKVVRVDLKAMANATHCMSNYRMEWLSNNAVQSTGVSAASACIFVLDLTTLHPDARGFRKGFAGYPYAYLSAGDFSVVVRLDMENYGISTAKALDLSRVDITLGGYSGGFVDGAFACFCPYKTFVGPVGGVRSKLPVDQNHLTTYFNPKIACVEEKAWHNVLDDVTTRSSLLVIDLSTFDSHLRGFSEAIRVGRYAYFAPLQYTESSHSGKLVRLYLGTKDINETVSGLTDIVVRGVHDLIDVIDLSKNDPRLKGYTGIYNVGKYLFLVPFRNTNEPQNGQRGHGLLTRVDMNQISFYTKSLFVDLGWKGQISVDTVLQQPATNIGWKGVTWIDLTTTQRFQTPNASDYQLRGFYGGFASGLYAYLVPFYNGVFSGKLARLVALEDWTLPITPTKINLQELDFTVDRTNPHLYKGFQGGFGSIWTGV